MTAEGRYAQVSDTAHDCHHEELVAIVDDGWHKIQCARCLKRWDSTSGKRKVGADRRIQELEEALREACDIGMSAHHSGGAGWRLALADLRKIANNTSEQLPSVSTRSSASEDARRDFDGFDVDEELRRLRFAMRDAQWRSAAELTSNIDEHLCRGGSFPVAWLGPSCMQDASDLNERIQSSLTTLRGMSPSVLKAMLGGRVAVRPLPATLPGSAWGVNCHEEDCVEALTLRRTTAARTTDEDDWKNLEPAHREAAVLLGWRLHEGVWRCPTHVVGMNLASARCQSACPACSCIGGPRGDAVDGIVVETTERRTP